MSKLLVVLTIIIFALNIYSQRSANDYNQRGLERHARGDYDGAIEDFTEAIELSSRLMELRSHIIHNLCWDSF